MKKIYIKLIAIAVISSFSLNLSKAQNLDDIKNKEIGLNFRNLWFGSAAELVIRKPIGENQFKRKTFRVSGNFQENNSALTGSTVVGLPDAYLTDMNSNFNLTASFGKEKRVPLLDQLYFYHGPTLITSVGFSKSRTAFGGLNAPSKQDQSNVMLGLGLGYFGGIGYQVSEKFSIQIDNLLQVSINSRLQNQSTSTFDTNTQTDETSNTITDKVTNSIGIPGSNISRIWVVFKF